MDSAAFRAKEFKLLILMPDAKATSVFECEGMIYISSVLILFMLCCIFSNTTTLIHLRFISIIEIKDGIQHRTMINVPSAQEPMLSRQNDPHLLHE